MSNALNTTVAHASVAGDIDTVYGAVQDLVDRLWPGMTEVVVAAAPRFLLHRVSIDGQDVDAWLTWELTPVGPGSSWTELRILHDELDTSGGPPPEIDHVMTLLVESLPSRRHGTTDAFSTSN